MQLTPPRIWPMWVKLASRAARSNGAAARTTDNGNQRALTRAYGLTAAALAGLAAGDRPDERIEAELADIERSYTHAGDFAGAGNCLAARAILSLQRADWAQAESRLRSAAELYARDRVDPIRSGAAFVHRVEALARAVRLRPR